MQPVRRCLLVSLSLVWTGSAVAQGLPIEGTWGDENGCKVLAQGVAFTDEYTILKADELRRHESSCEILDVKTAKTGEHVVRTLCGGEGELWLNDFVVVADPEDKTVLRIHGGPGGGEPYSVRPCG